VNNYKLKNVNNINNIITNDKIEPNKKSIKPNLVLDSINDIKNNRNTTDSKKSNINDKNIIFKNEKYGNNNKLDLDTKNKFFIKILKQDDSYLNTIKPITKEELLSYSNEKEKIIFLLEKNRELINILRNINEKYKMLKSEYIDLYKSININNLNSNENDEYKNYLSDENKTLKIKLDNYENIFTVMTSYINDISNKLNLKKINIIDLKNNININEFKKNTKNTPLNDFIHILNDNKKIICKYIEVWNNNIKTEKNKDKILNKIKSLSNYEQNGKVSRDKILISRKDSKYKKKK
jgi:chromosome segregation protein